MAKDNFVLKHILVPKHSKLGERATKELLEKLNIEREQLPKILLKDPAIANLKVKVGDVIAIERESPTAGKSRHYRVVIDA